MGSPVVVLIYLILQGPLAGDAQVPVAAKVSADRSFAWVTCPAPGEPEVGRRAVLVAGGAPVGLGRVAIRDETRAGVELEWSSPELVAGSEVVFFATDADGNPVASTLVPAAGAVIKSVEFRDRVRLAGDFPRAPGRPLWAFRNGKAFAKLATLDGNGTAAVTVCSGPVPIAGDRVAAAPVLDGALPVLAGRVIAAAKGSGGARVTLDLGEADGIRADDRFEIFRKGFVAVLQVEAVATHTCTGTVYQPQARTAVEVGDIAVRVAAATARVFRIERDYMLLSVGETAGVREGDIFEITPADDVPAGAAEPGRRAEPLRVTVVTVKVGYCGAAPAPAAGGSRSKSPVRLWDRARPASGPAAETETTLALGSAFCSGRFRRVEAGRSAGLVAGVRLRTLAERSDLLTVVWSDDRTALAWVAAPTAAAAGPSSDKARICPPSCLRP